MPDAGSEMFVFRDVSFDHPNTTTETDMVEHAKLKERIVHHFDFSVFAQITTIRVYERINTINYRIIGLAIYPTDFATGVTGVTIVTDGAGQDMKISLESATQEGAIRTVKGTTRDELRQ